MLLQSASAMIKVCDEEGEEMEKKIEP